MVSATIAPLTVPNVLMRTLAPTAYQTPS